MLPHHTNYQAIIRNNKMSEQTNKMSKNESKNKIIMVNENSFPMKIHYVPIFKTPKI